MIAEMQPGVPDPVAGVFDVEIVTAAGAERHALPGLLIELPHGATRRRHFEATRSRLIGELPDDLEQFFFVNTDVGSIEVARWIARMVTNPAGSPELAGVGLGEGSVGPRAVERVVILRGLVARTFIDCNRVIEGGPSGSLREGLTPGLPAYVTRAGDVRTLKGLHAAYQAAAERAYQAVCGAGGRALILHTYAPRSIEVEAVDQGIVAALRRAYAPGNYETWERRPGVDMISESAEGRRLAPEGLVQAVRERYERIGVEVAENATYRLHQSTMGYVHSVRYPGQVLCMEISRELLAEPFTPFAEMTISEDKARRMAGPLAAAVLSTA